MKKVEEIELRSYYQSEKDILEQIVVRVSEKGNFYTDYRGFRIVVKQKNGTYKGKAYGGEVTFKLVPSTNFRSLLQMAIDHIDENY